MVVKFFNLVPNSIRIGERLKINIYVFQKKNRGEHTRETKKNESESQHPAQHNTIRNILKAEARTANLNPATNEPAGLLDLFGRFNDRPADVFIPNFVNGRDTCIDVAIVSSFTDMANAAITAGHNARRSEEGKRNKYEADVDRLRMTFVPFVMESLGGFGAGRQQVFRALGPAIAAVDYMSPRVAITRLKIKLQCKWMRLLGASLAAQAAYASSVSDYHIPQP